MVSIFLSVLVSKVYEAAVAYSEILMLLTENDESVMSEIRPRTLKLVTSGAVMV